MKGEFMEKKVYLAPEAELVVFYSEDDSDRGGSTVTPDLSTPGNDKGWL